MQPEVSLGIIPCFGGIKRLIQLLGISKAKELLFLGRQITADEAFALGLVNKVVAYGLAHSAARDLARTLNSLSFYSLRQLKQTINFFATLNSEQISNKEAKNFAACFNFSDLWKALMLLQPSESQFLIKIGQEIKILLYF